MIAGQAGNPARAAVWFDKAIQADSSQVHAYVNRGLALHADMRLEAALASYDQAIQRQPGYSDAHFNRGNVLLELGRLQDSLASYDAAAAVDAGRVDVLCNRGVVLTQLGQFDAAVSSFDRAITLRSDHAKSHLNRAFVRLAQGDFLNGWADYEWRGIDAGAERTARFSQPRWHGAEPIAGRTVLLWSEQGFGDTIQFCRYASLVAAAGARVVLEVQPPLAGLLSNVAGASQLVVRGDALPPFDFQCPLLSLPLAFKTSLDTIPLPGAYLHCDPRKAAQWRGRLGEKTRPRIGLVWSGSASNRNERNRAVSLEELLRLLPPHYDYFRLQKDARAEDLKTLRANPRILDFSAEFTDFSDTAALCDCMDVVVSTCTSVAHLSAALGVKTFILLGHAADWRWLLDRADSPWYASAKLYRRRKADGWNDVIERMAADLPAALK